MTSWQRATSLCSPPPVYNWDRATTSSQSQSHKRPKSFRVSAPDGGGARSVLPGVHHPTDVGLLWWVGAVAGFLLPQHLEKEKLKIRFEIVSWSAPYSWYLKNTASKQGLFPSSSSSLSCCPVENQHRYYCPLCKTKQTPVYTCKTANRPCGETCKMHVCHFCQRFTAVSQWRRQAAPFTQNVEEDVIDICIF